MIQPWDKFYLEPIAKAIERSSPGVSSVIDKEVIRISLPPLTEEYWKNLLRIISEKQKEGRKTVRSWREEAWSEIQEKAKAEKFEKMINLEQKTNFRIW